MFGSSKYKTAKRNIGYGYKRNYSSTYRSKGFGSSSNHTRKKSK